MPSRRSASPLQVKKPAMGFPAFLFRQEEPKHAVPDPDLPRLETKSLDYTSLLSDELIRRILSLLPAEDFNSASLVSRKWLRILGESKRSLTLFDWSFLESSRLFFRFPSLSKINLVPALFIPHVISHERLLSSGSLSIPLAQDIDISEKISRFLCAEKVGFGLELLGRNFTNLTKLSLVAVASEISLVKLGGHCVTLQELELHGCADGSLRAISAFSNLQILKLVGSVKGLYAGSGVTDVGLTILAHGCTRLVKLELSRCEGGFEGISSVGRCCLMLEELTIHDHDMDAGWMGGLSFCRNLKTLRLLGCKRIDDPGGNLDELVACEALERLHLQRCQIRVKKSFSFLLLMCRNAREVIFQHCWGLDDDMFSSTIACRYLYLTSMASLFLTLYIVTSFSSPTQNYPPCNPSLPKIILLVIALDPRLPSLSSLSTQLSSLSSLSTKD